MNTEATPKSENASDWLVHQWIVAGIVSGSARFIPIPFVDDVVRDQCRRFVVSRTMSAHASNLPLDRLKPYFASSGGCVGGCAGMFLKAPLTLLLFPVRKFVSMVTSVRGVPLEVMRMVLLGRTLDRYLREGKLEGNVTQSTKMRAAFDESFARMDFHVARALIADSLASVAGWKAAAMRSAKQVAGQRDPEADGLDESKDVQASAENIRAVLDRPETLTLFSEFDRRFDEWMGK